jgi:hypothetical protein
MTGFIRRAKETSNATFVVRKSRCGASNSEATQYRGMRLISIVLLRSKNAALTRLLNMPKQKVVREVGGDYKLKRLVWKRGRQRGC